jgi:Tol biopolymer transport system component
VSDWIGGACGLAWSPDGSQIVFSFPGGYTSNLDVVNVNGSGRKHLTPRWFYDTNPVWSPQGRIYFNRLDDAWFGEVASINPDGSGLEYVTAATQGAGFSLSPDGRWLLLWDSRSGGCVRMAASGRGGQIAVLKKWPGRRAAPGQWYIVGSSWSADGGTTWPPDSSRIVFSAGLWSGAAALYIMRPDGSNVRKVPHTDGGTNPVW